MLADVRTPLVGELGRHLLCPRSLYQGYRDLQRALAILKAAMCTH